MDSLNGGVGELSTTARVTGLYMENIDKLLIKQHLRRGKKMDGLKIKVKTTDGEEGVYSFAQRLLLLLKISSTRVLLNCLQKIKN
jgi:hypothetical protein